MAMLDSEQKKRLVAELVPAVVAPVARAGTEFYFQSKMIDMEREAKVDIAERRAESARKVGRALDEGETASDGREDADARSVGPDADLRDPEPSVYDNLRRLRSETDCGFCYSAAEALLDSDRETAKSGLTELRQYEETKRELESANAGEQEIEREMAAVVENWETVPRIYGQSV